MKPWFSCDGKGGLDSAPKIPRRSMLAGGMAGLGSLLLARHGLAQASFQVSPEHDNVLVVIFLRGGADGLNMVAPYSEDDYYRGRPTIAVKKPGGGTDSLLDLDGHFGLHPALAAMKPIWDDRQLAVIHAVGSGDQTRSHFEAMATMERGLGNDVESAGGGWLGRHLLSTPGKDSPLRAISISDFMPDSLGGALGAVSMLSLADYRLNTPDKRALGMLEKLYSLESDVMAQAGHDTIAVLRSLAKEDPSSYKPEHGAAYADNPLAKALREIAFLMKRDMGLEAAVMDSHLWDTHVAQGGATGWQATLLKDLGDAVGAFYKDLGPLRKKVTLVIQTEFGRRVDENSGLGTDHGRGSVMFVAGGHVKGGIHGGWPTIAKEKLEGPGDLRVVNDYRDVLGEILQKRLYTSNLRKVFPTREVRPLGILS
jgi:uncharacterized protein (DUF1501 family)